MTTNELELPLAYQASEDPDEPVMASGYEIAEMISQFQLEDSQRQRKGGRQLRRVLP